MPDSVIGTGSARAVRGDPVNLAEVPASLLRDYVDEIDGTRVIYYVTALGSITIIAYVEA